MPIKTDDNNNYYGIKKKKKPNKFGSERLIGCDGMSTNWGLF